MTDSQSQAVLTGDLVASAEMAAPALEQAMATLADTAREISTWAGASLRFTRNRGDGWQVCLARPGLDLRAALRFRAALRRENPRWDSRIALARGPVSLGSGDLNSASGEAFVAAGRGLDAIARPALWAHANGGALAAATRLADHLSQGWTQAQARAIAPMLDPEPPTHAAVAARYGITRQAVTQALDAAGYDALATALTLLEAEGAAPR
jgi:hypothetical protein